MQDLVKREVKRIVGCVLVLLGITIITIAYVIHPENASAITSERVTDYDDLYIRPSRQENVNLARDPATKEEDSQGYILPYYIYEEQTNGANNLWHLQIYAKIVGMMAVEPFAQDSMFGMSKLAPNFNKSLRFGDYFNKEKWNKMVIDNGGNPLVGWEEFVSEAPRDAIILYTLVKHNLEEPFTITYGDEMQRECKLKVPKNDLLWLSSIFNIIRTVCYRCDQNKPHRIPIEEFTSRIFGNTRPNEVTLITVGWFGVRKGRLELQTSNKVSWHVYKVLPPSEKVIMAYENYVSHNIGDHKYVGIVFRTRYVLHIQDGNFSGDQYLLQCSKNLSHVLDKVREKWKIFLAYDMGIFGSKRYSMNTKKQLASLQEQIFLDVFNGSLQIKQREEMLIQAAGGITDRGFIAQLEKMIATNADCIILLGARSSFVRSSARQYMSLHPTDKCVVSVCSEVFRDAHHNIVSSSVLPN